MPDIPSPPNLPGQGGSFSGTIPTNALQDVGQLLGTLLSFRWRDVDFPYTETSLDLRQDLAIHKFIDRDGAHVEGTGRAPLQISARIPFLNGLERGPHELWAAPLYPTTWRKFIEACADKTSGVLQHPELGPLTCKVENVRTVWSAHVRSGVHVDVTWIETDDTKDDLQSALADSSPLAGLQGFAADIDIQFKQLKKDPRKGFPPDLGMSFTDMVNQIKAVIDYPSLLQHQLAGAIDNVLWNAQRLTQSIENLGTASGTLAWPLVDSCQRIQSAAYAVKQTLLTKGQSIKIYITQQDGTLSSVANTLGAAIGDIVTLNPSLMAVPIIVQGTRVRYYAR